MKKESNKVRRIIITHLAPCHQDDYRVTLGNDNYLFTERELIAFANQIADTVEEVSNEVQ